MARAGYNEGVRILGIGTDLVSIERIEGVLKRHPQFAEKILTRAERERANTPSYLAGRWAAKEAIYKAIGHLNWHEIEVVGKSRPTARLLVSHPLGPVHIELSISHERELALAFAVVTSGSHAEDDAQ